MVEGVLNVVREELLVTRDFYPQERLPRYGRALVQLAVGQTLDLRLTSGFAGAPGGLALLLHRHDNNQISMHKPHPTSEERRQPVRAPRGLAHRALDLYRLDDRANKTHFGGIRRLLLLPSLVESEIHGSPERLLPGDVEKYGAVSLVSDELNQTDEVHVVMPKPSLEALRKGPAAPPEVTLRVVEGWRPRLPNYA